MKIMKPLFLFLPALLLLTSCEKFLEKVPDKSLTILTTIEQYRQLLDERQLYVNAPGIAEFGTDDYYVSFEDWQSRLYIVKNAYTWEKDIYEGNSHSNGDWYYPYNVIYHTNIVLGGLKGFKIGAGDKVAYDNLKGQALFMRAYQYYLLQEIYGKPYNPESSSTDMGVPLKLSPDVGERVQRASVQETFDQILADLKGALRLVSDEYPVTSKYRISKAAVLAMLSRVYLTMQDYPKAESYADSSLMLYPTLMDYNKLDTLSNAPFVFPDNEEVLFLMGQLSYGLYLVSPTSIIDSTLYGSYGQYDLRKRHFFGLSNDQKPYLKAVYTGTKSPFGGIATDEVYLISAEAKARNGKVGEAMERLNALLTKRFITGKFVPLDADEEEAVLTIILAERRKELIGRGLRWSDLRRLNQDPRFAKELKRILNGTEYTLPPNDARYTYPVPPSEIAISGIEQIER